MCVHQHSLLSQGYLYNATWVFLSHWKCSGLRGRGARCLCTAWMLLSAGTARCSELALCMCPDPGFWLPAVQELSHCGLRGKGEGQQKAYTVKQAQKLRTVLPSSLIFWTIHSSLSSSFVLLQGCTGMVKLSISLM